MTKVNPREFKLNSSGDLDGLKNELVAQFGNSDFTRLTLLTRRLSGVVSHAALDRRKSDGTFDHFSYNFETKERQEENSSEKLSASFLALAEPIRTEKKFEDFKIEDLDLHALLPKFEEAIETIKRKPGRKICVISNLIFSENFPRDGKITTTFQVRASQSGNEEEKYQEFPCTVLS